MTCQMKHVQSTPNIGLALDNFSTGLYTPMSADVKTGSVVYLSEIEQQSPFCTIGQFLGLVTKREVVL